MNTCIHLFISTRCKECNCNTAGSEGTNCDQNTGACVCKKNVQGTLCGTCKSGFGFLNKNDPFGCSSGRTIRNSNCSCCWKQWLYAFVNSIYPR